MEEVCWLVFGSLLFKSQPNLDLTKTQGDDNERFRLDTEFKTTPILTLFFPASNGSSTIISQPEAHLTCIKPVRKEALAAVDDTTGSSGNGNFAPTASTSGGAGRLWESLPSVKKLAGTAVAVGFMTMELFCGGI